MKDLEGAIWDKLYPMLEQEHRAFASYIVSDIVDLVRVKCRVPGYKGKWMGSQYEEAAYGGILDDYSVTKQSNVGSSDEK